MRGGMQHAGRRGKWGHKTSGSSTCMDKAFGAACLWVCNGTRRDVLVARYRLSVGDVARHAMVLQDVDYCVVASRGGGEYAGRWQASPAGWELQGVNGRS